MKPRKNISSRISDRIRAWKTSIRKLTGRSDYDRWSPLESLQSAWDSRTVQIAKLVEDNQSVIEFGAGRQIIKDHLPKGCHYVPSDIVDRGNGTIVCDLNSNTLPIFPKCDVAVFSGVLEYVNDISMVVRHLKESVDTIITSYAITEYHPVNRRKHGWVNDYSSEAFTELFASLGFDLLHSEDWGLQRIFVFKKVLMV